MDLFYTNRKQKNENFLTQHANFFLLLCFTFTTKLAATPTMTVTFQPVDIHTSTAN